MQENKNIAYLQIVVMAMIALVMIMVTYIIVDYKTQNVVNQLLNIEYDKVGGKENYDKITNITRDQTIEGLKKYEAQGGQAAIQGQAQQVVPAPIPAGGELSQERVAGIKKDVYILGNPDAEVTWVEYSDLECPFCKKLHQAGTIDEVLDDYDGKVNFVFKQFPLNFHPNAPKESEAALCAGELGGSEKYYEYISTIFERTRGNGRGFALDALTPLAVELGLEENTFSACLDSGKYADRVNAEMAEGQTFGITGTPGNVLINNKTGAWDKLPGAYGAASFKQKIDALLQ